MEIWWFDGDISQWSLSERTLWFLGLIAGCDGDMMIWRWYSAVIIIRLIRNPITLQGLDLCRHHHNGHVDALTKNIPVLYSNREPATILTFCCWSRLLSFIICFLISVIGNEMCAQTSKICKYLLSNWTNMSHFQPLDGVCRGSETQLKVAENLNYII